MKLNNFVRYDEFKNITGFRLLFRENLYFLSPFTKRKRIKIFLTNGIKKVVPQNIFVYFAYSNSLQNLTPFQQIKSNNIVIFSLLNHFRHVWSTSKGGKVLQDSDVGSWRNLSWRIRLYVRLSWWRSEYQIDQLWLHIPFFGNPTRKWYYYSSHFWLEVQSGTFHTCKFDIMQNNFYTQIKVFQVKENNEILYSFSANSE